MEDNPPPAQLQNELLQHHFSLFLRERILRFH